MVTHHATSPIALQLNAAVFTLTLPSLLQNEWPKPDRGESHARKDTQLQGACVGRPQMERKPRE